MAASDFFSRWAKKSDSGGTSAPAGQAWASGQPVADMPTAATAATEPGEPTEPPSVEQARQLTPADDFRAFVQPDVAPEVRNTAMRQLFTDPHFNVMDGLDIYIDDYSQPDPLPAGMLQRMASAQFMKLVPEPSPEVQAVTGHPQDPAEDVGPQVQGEVVAQSPLSSPNAAVSAPHHDHPDLQLQPDLAPADPEPGSRPG